MTTSLAKRGDVGDVGRIQSPSEGWHRVPLSAATAATPTALTAASGSGSDTVNDVGASFNQTTLNNNFRSVADKINELITRDKVADDFEIQGTDNANATAAVQSDGSVLLTTHTDANDQAILAGRASSWMATVDFTPSKLPAFRVQLLIPDITDVIVWAGLKLTNVAVVATDDDQAFMRLESGVNDGELQVITSVADSDVTTDTNIAIAANDVIDYIVVVDEARRPHHYLGHNGGPLRPVAIGAAMTAAAQLKAFVGVQTKAGNAATLRVWKPRLALQGQ